MGTFFGNLRMVLHMNGTTVVVGIFEVETVLEVSVVKTVVLSAFKAVSVDEAVVSELAIVFGFSTVNLACHIPGPINSWLLKSDVNLTFSLFDLVRLAGG